MMSKRFWDTFLSSGQSLFGKRAERFVLHNAEQVDGQSTMSYPLCLCIQ